MICEDGQMANTGRYRVFMVPHFHLMLVYDCNFYWKNLNSIIAKFTKEVTCSVLDSSVASFYSSLGLSVFSMQVPHSWHIIKSFFRELQQAKSWPERIVL